MKIDDNMQLAKTEVLFDEKDTEREVPKNDNSHNGLSATMLKSAFGPDFDPMLKEAIFGDATGLN